MGNWMGWNFGRSDRGINARQGTYTEVSIVAEAVDPDSGVYQGTITVTDRTKGGARIGDSTTVIGSLADIIGAANAVQEAGERSTGTAYRARQQMRRDIRTRGDEGIYRGKSTGGRAAYDPDMGDMGGE